MLGWITLSVVIEDINFMEQTYRRGSYSLAIDDAAVGDEGGMSLSAVMATRSRTRKW